MHMMCSWLCPLSTILLIDALPFPSPINSRPWVDQTSSLAASYTNHRLLNSDSPVSSQVEESKKQFTMIRAKKIAQIARGWQKMVSLGKKHLTLETALESDEHCASVACKGNCVVYRIDGKRFEVPLAYLGKKVFEEFLRMSQEEFGFTAHGQIILPCDAATMEYAMSLLRRSVSEEVEKAFLSTMAAPCHRASCVATSVGFSQQVAVCSS